ncbi:MAG: RNA polymerase sigma factor [Pirellulales bacterium]
MAEYEDDFCGLMRLVSNGSEDAAWQLVTRYGEDIRRAVRRVLNVKLRPKFDSLDFVQLVWKSFFRARGNCDRFHRPEELAAYLAAMARNKVGMETRRRLATKKHDVQQEQSLVQFRAEEMAGRQPAPIDIAIAHEQWEQMLKDQPAHYRRIIHLRLQGHTCHDIGKAVRLDERSVRRFLTKLLHTTSV